MNRGFLTCGKSVRVLTGFFLFVGPFTFVLADDPQIPRRRRQQQATVEVARQLIAAVLDIQINQFTANGLDTLPVFSDIQQMRDNIDHVIDEDMRLIIDLLNQAQRTSDQRQAGLLREARGKARDVVTILMAERERLRRRLKVAHVQAQLRQLIDQQQRVRSKTRQLHTTPRDQSDRATLSVLEDQRDAHTLFEQLTESLETVQRWESKESQAAAEGMEQMREEGVEQLFDSAESDLAKGNIDDAEQDQGAIIEQLSAVLDRIEAAQGLQPFDPSSTLEKVRGLLKDQQQLADETRGADANDQSALDELSQRQKAIHGQLGKLDSSGNDLAGGAQLLRQATSAAMQAERDLFEGDHDSAMEQQQEIVRDLDQLESLLEAAESTAASSKATSSKANDSLASQVDQLEQLGQNLDELSERQDQVLADTFSDPQSAQDLQQNVAGSLSEEARRALLPEKVQQAVQSAADLAEQAAKTMRNQSPQSSATRSEAAEGVQQAIQTAQARTAAQLQSARSAMQRANAQTMPATSGQPSRSGAQQASRAMRGESRRGTPSRGSNSKLTAPKAVSSRRTVGDAQRSGDRRNPLGGRAYADSPWFARLPPELREAIRMRGRRQAPRGYEERLRRYFESVDK